MNKKVIFWSSVDASIFMGAIINGINDYGIKAEHKFLISSTDYRNATSFFERIVLRLRMYVLYPIKLGYECYFDREDRIFVVTTNTFYAPLIAILFSRKNQKVVHLVWDLFPNVILHSQKEKKENIIHKFIKIIVQITINKACLNIFLGETLLKYAQFSFKIKSKTLIIPVGADNEKFSNSPPKFLDNNSKVEILYCGNLGSMHDIETIVQWFQYYNGVDKKSYDVSFSFCASGSKYELLQKKVNKINYPFVRNINFEQPLDNQNWIKMMKKAHVALVTMESGSENIVMPSKTYSAISAGQAILAICPLNSDLAKLVKEENCGWVIAPGNINELSNAIIEMSTDRELLFNKRKNAFLAGQNKYSYKTIGQSWAKNLKMISENVD